jgi:hypothetical protein
MDSNYFDTVDESIIEYLVNKELESIVVDDLADECDTIDEKAIHEPVKDLNLSIDDDNDEEKNESEFMNTVISNQGFILFIKTVFFFS